MSEDYLIENDGYFGELYSVNIASDNCQDSDYNLCLCLNPKEACVRVAKVICEENKKKYHYIKDQDYGLIFCIPNTEQTFCCFLKMIDKNLFERCQKLYNSKEHIYILFSYHPNKTHYDVLDNINRDIKEIWKDISNIIDDEFIKEYSEYLYNNLQKNKSKHVKICESYYYEILTVSPLVQNMLENYLPMKEKIAKLECEPYKGEEFFIMLKEEKNSGLIS